MRGLIMCMCLTFTCTHKDTVSPIITTIIPTIATTCIVDKLGELSLSQLQCMT